MKTIPVTKNPLLSRAPHDQAVDDSTQAADQQLARNHRPDAELLHVVVAADATHQGKERVCRNEDRSRSPKITSGVATPKSQASSSIVAVISRLATKPARNPAPMARRRVMP